MFLETCERCPQIGEACAADAAAAAAAILFSERLLPLQVIWGFHGSCESAGKHLGVPRRATPTFSLVAR